MKKNKKKRRVRSTLSSLWAEARKGSGWSGADSDAFAIILSGPKGVAIIPQGDIENVRKLADGFSVMAKAGSSDVKMVEVEEVEVFSTADGRYMIAGGGISISINTKDSERVRRFFDGRVFKERKLRLVISLSDFYK